MAEEAIRRIIKQPREVRSPDGHQLGGARAPPAEGVEHRGQCRVTWEDLGRPTFGFVRSCGVS